MDVTGVPVETYQEGVLTPVEVRDDNHGYCRLRSDKRSEAPVSCSCSEVGGGVTKS